MGIKTEGDICGCSSFSFVVTVICSVGLSICLGRGFLHLSSYGDKPTFFILWPGKKNKLRVYYLSWLRNKILHNDPEVEKKQGWTTVGDLEGCVHYKVGE